VPQLRDSRGGPCATSHFSSSSNTTRHWSERLHSPRAVGVHSTAVASDVIEDALVLARCPPRARSAPTYCSMTSIGNMSTRSSMNTRTSSGPYGTRGSSPPVVADHPVIGSSNPSACIHAAASSGRAPARCRWQPARPTTVASTTSRRARPERPVTGAGCRRATRPARRSPWASNGVKHDGGLQDVAGARHGRQAEDHGGAGSLRHLRWRSTTSQGQRTSWPANNRSTPRCQPGGCHSATYWNASRFDSICTGNTSSLGPIGFDGTQQGAERGPGRAPGAPPRADPVVEPPPGHQQHQHTGANGNEPWVFTQSHMIGTSQRGSSPSSAASSTRARPSAPNSSGRSVPEPVPMATTMSPASSRPTSVRPAW
jgi:hypothetical protein